VVKLVQSCVEKSHICSKKLYLYQLETFLLLC